MPHPAVADTVHQAIKPPVQTGYILPGLDGLRALAVALVLVYHLLPQWMPTGMIGVDVFFVISGFLITGLLVKEQRQYGRLNLPRFWIRRIRRLVPAILLLVLVSVPAALAVGGDALTGMGRQVLGALSFTSNWTNIAAGNEYFTQTSPEIFTHLWSLAVEEQFYLIWPPLVGSLFLLGLRWRRCAWIAGGLAIASALSMLILIQSGASASRVYYGTDTHLFGLLAGAAVALAWPWALQRVSAEGRLRRLRSSWLSRNIAGPAAVLGLIALALSGSGANPLVLHPWGLVAATGLSLLALISVILDAQQDQSGPFVRLLEQRWVLWVGQRSYGIYLWHWPIFVLFLYAAPGLDPLIRAGLVLALSISAAGLSYRYVEQPIRQRGFRSAMEAAWKQLAGDGPAGHVTGARIGVVLILMAACATGHAAAIAPQHSDAQDFVQAGQQALQNQQNTRPSPTAAPREDPSATAPANPDPEPNPTQPENKNSPLDDDAHPTAPITGDKITFIGDSVGVAASPALLNQLAGIDIYADTSRFIWDGVDILDRLENSGTLREVVVISLATNGEVTADILAELIAEAGPDREIYLVNGHGPTVEWIPENNQAIAAAAQRYQNVHLVDWDAAIAGHPELLASDGIHPSAAGGDLYVRTIREAFAGS